MDWVKDEGGSHQEDSSEVESNGPSFEREHLRSCAHEMPGVECPPPGCFQSPNKNKTLTSGFKDLKLEKKKKTVSTQLP